jgi:hemerythrin-like domain-containing protein
MTDFNEPLQALGELHGRLRSHCDALMKLIDQVGAGGSSAAAQAAAATLRRHFDRLAGCVHQDEEQDLFPALLESMAGSDAVCIRQMIEARVAEHREIEERWLRIREWLGAAGIAGAVGPTPREDVASFVRLYGAHLAQEDQELLPMAERLLSEDALAQVADSMRRRHGALG